jgi:hypothetical protein
MHGYVKPKLRAAFRISAYALLGPAGEWENLHIGGVFLGNLSLSLRQTRFSAC